MKNKFLLVFLAILVFALISCKKEDDSEQIDFEKRIFQAYLENNNISAEPTESGLYYIEETPGDGATPKNGDWVLINYDLYLIDGEQIIYTSDRTRSIEYNIYDSRLIYGISKLQIGTNIAGFDEGLYKMKEGGKSRLLFMSDLGYGKQGAGLITSYSSLLIEVELLKVIPDPAAYEKEMIAEYLESNNFMDIDTTKSGLYYIPVEEGSGDSARMNAYVTVNIDGYLLDGRKFLEEDIYRFQLGSFDYSLTAGLVEGISYMKETGKARLIVPYYLGYGVQGKSYFEGKAKVPIPPYSTLIYDVELINAK
jgi:FKBP-type peptidyl-prolyl cis-trans isomerase